MFEIRLHVSNPKSVLASTQYSDHASEICKTMTNRYAHRCNVFECLPGVQPRLVEYWSFEQVTEKQLKRTPIDPRTSEPYA